MHPPNESQRYILTSSLTGWVHIQVNPAIYANLFHIGLLPLGMIYLIIYLVNYTVCLRPILHNHKQTVTVYFLITLSPSKLTTKQMC